MSDQDEGIVHRALTAALDGCPRAAVPLIVRHVERGALPPEVLALGIRVVGTARAPETLDWLLGHVATRGRVLRREKLVAKSPAMLAALAGLAAGWRDEPRADAVLQRARQSADAEIRAAATVRRRTSERSDSVS